MSTNPITETEQEILARMETCRDMAVSLARPYARREGVRVDESDALTNAMFHLWRAARGFDEARRYEFTTYAHHAISNGLRADYRLGRGLSRKYPIRKDRRALDNRLRRVSYLDADDQLVDRSPQPDIELADLEQNEFDILRIHIAAQSIGERSMQVLLRRCDGQGLKEIGEVLGVSKQRVEQIEKKAIAEIRVRCGLRECGREAS